MQVSAFMLTRKTPTDKFEEYTSETSALFAQKFGEPVSALIAEMRANNLADFGLDLDVEWVGLSISANIPERLQFISSRLKSREGVNSLKLPYHRHLITIDVDRIRGEIEASGITGDIIITAPKGDIEGYRFSLELQRLLSRERGWKADLSDLDLSGNCFSIDSSPLVVYGTSASASILRTAFKSIFISPIDRRLDRGDPELKEFDFKAESNRIPEDRGL